MKAKYYMTRFISIFSNVEKIQIVLAAFLRNSVSWEVQIFICIKFTSARKLITSETNNEFDKFGTEMLI